MSSTPDTPNTPDGNKFINDLYHSAGYAQLKTVLKSQVPKLDFNVRDAGMFVADVALSMATKEFLILRKIIPMNILN